MESTPAPAEPPTAAAAGPQAGVVSNTDREVWVADPVKGIRSVSSQPDLWYSNRLISRAAAGPLSSTGCWTVRPDQLRAVSKSSVSALPALPPSRLCCGLCQDTRLPKPGRGLTGVGVSAGAATQEQVYGHAAADAVTDLLNGINGCVFAYGQTGSGKSRESHALDSFCGRQTNASTAARRHNVWESSGRPAAHRQRTGSAPAARRDAQFGACSRPISKEPFACRSWEKCRRPSLANMM